MGAFYSFFFGLTAIQAILLYLVIPTLGAPAATSLLFWLQFGLFSAITFFTVWLGFGAMRKGSFSTFQGIFFLSIFAKLILAGTIALLVKNQFPDGGVSLALPIAIAYLPYLAFEIYWLVNFSRKLN